MSVPATSRPCDELLDVIAEHEAALGQRNRWIPSRLILVNYWVFGYQECHFVDGHIILHGGNGTGKTTILTAALPLALFGTRFAGSLDTLSGRARTLEYYLLGSKDDERDKLCIEDQRVSYVAWEFRHGHTGEYLTIGQCLRGRRKSAAGVKIDSWGFCIRDGRRIGIDLALFEHKNGVREPVAPEDLEQVIIPNARVGATGTRIVEGANDYTALVAKELYGTDRVDDVRGMVKTLLTIRRPILNGSLNPEVVMGMLSTSLPELDPEIIDSLDRALQGLDRIRQEATEAREQSTSVATLLDGHSAFVVAKATRTAMQLLFEQALVDREDGTINAADKTLRQTEKDLETARRTLAENESSKRAAEQARTGLQGSEVFSLADRAKQAREQKDQAADAVKGAEGRLARAETAMAEAERAVARAEEAWGGASKELVHATMALRDTADDAKWAAARVIAQRLLEVIRTLTIDEVPPLPEGDQPLSLEGAGRERTAHLGKLIDAERAVAQHETQVRDATAQLGPKRDAHRQAERDRDEANRTVETQRRAADFALQSWASSHAAAEPDADAIAHTLATIAGYDDPSVSTSLLKEELLRGLSDRSERLGKEAEDERHHRRQISDRLEERRRERTKIAAEPEHRPDPRPGQAEVRAALAAAGIPAAPLYAVVNIAPGVDDATGAAIEAMLTDAGVRDALVVSPTHQDEARACIAALALPTGGDRWLLTSKTVDADSDAADASDAPFGAPLTDYLVAAGDEFPHGVITRTLAMIRVLRDDGDRMARDAYLAIRNTATITLDLESGTWEHGIVRGRQSTEAEAAEYLGLDNRRAARERRITALDEELKDLDARLTQLDATIDTIQRARASVERAERDLRNFEALEELRSALRHMKDREAMCRRAEDALRKASEDVTTAMSNLDGAKAVRDRCRLAVPDLASASLDGLVAIQTATKTWIERATRWRGRWDAVRREVEAAQDARARDIREREAHALQVQEHERLFDQLQGIAKTVNMLETELANAGHAEITERIAAYDQQIDAAEKEIARLNREIGSLEDSLKSTADERKKAVERKTAPLQAAEEYTQQLLGQLDRHLALATAKVRLQQPGGTPVAVARYLTGKPGTSRKELLDAETTLNEASLSWFSAWNTLRPRLDDQYAPEALADDRVRVVVNETYQYGLEALRDHLDMRVTTLDAAFQEKEADLYRSVFLDEMSDGIRAALRDASAMVKAINTVLQDTKLKDDEQLSLKWTLKKPDGPLDEQLHRLVDILTKRSLKASPDHVIEWVHKYFSDRIAELKAKHGTGKPDQKTSFRDALASAFDYRDWFEFHLYSKQLGATQEQEITNARFGVRSGGQKVSATLVPLLAAIRVQSRSFTDDAPRIIALDEAFVGVDSENTDALFAILEQFEMSWIMTSDKLWGVSQELPGAMTQVLQKTVLPHKPSVVAADHIVWDGTYRHDSTSVRRAAFTSN